jgi:hypothetical protein
MSNFELSLTSGSSSNQPVDSNICNNQTNDKSSNFHTLAGLRLTMFLQGMMAFDPLSATRHKNCYTAL